MCLVNRHQAAEVLESSGKVHSDGDRSNGGNTRSRTCNRAVPVVTLSSASRQPS
jgi:hypothetical protein